MAAKNTPDTEAAEAPVEEAPIEAAREETQPVAPVSGEQTVVTKVWAAAGPVPKASVLQTAIQSVRDAIPVVYQLEAEITGAEKTHANKDKGTEDGTTFEVTITYTPRETVGKEDPVDLDKVIKGLDVPRSFDGIGGHDGDPDFLEHKTSGV